MMKKQLCFILLLTASVATAQENNSFSLAQAMDYASQNSPLVKNANVDIAIYQQKVKEVTAIGLPQINMEGNFNAFLNIPTSVIPAAIFNPAAGPDDFIPVQFGTKYTTSAGVTLSQLLFDGSYIVALKATKSLSELQMQLENKTDIDVRYEVAKAYYMAAVAEENEKTLSFTLKNLEQLLSETKAINKEGLIELQDVEQFELTVESMKNNISRAQNMKTMAYNLLKLHMGIDVSKEISLTDNIESLTKDISADYASKEFTSSSLIEYKLLQLQVRLDELNIKNEKMKYYPSFVTFLSHSYNLPSNELDMFDRRRWFPTSIWGLQLKVPVFASGMKHARVQQAKLSMEKSMTTLSNTENALKMQAQNAKLNFNFANENVITMKKNMELADKIQQKTLIKYKEGVSSSLDLNQAQMQYLNAQSNYINGLYSLITAKNDLDKAYGTIQPAAPNAVPNK